jgi:eukaryotic-like serine/threonine-protein kinase
MTLAVGARLGHYEILAAIGVGGMGEVYRARDTKLGREVALKILPATVVGDPERVARFRRESQLLASLNHPNIGAIYGVEESHDVRALVLELVDGPTLADHIAQGALPVADALPIARQIAEALEAAHEQGVVHRDLKPANIKLRPDGVVKVLDFGLAKMLETAPAPSALGMSPTLSVHATDVGVILGTATYMSPEQARGRPVDKRADVWAFGCVLFEMLAGVRPFDGEHVTEAFAAVIHDEPAWDVLPENTPARVCAVLERCLQKDPKDRARDIGDVRLALDGAFESRIATTGTTPAADASMRSGSLWRRLAAYAAVLIAGIALAVLGVWAMASLTAPAPQLSRFRIVPPPAQPLNTTSPDRGIAISPDGSHLVYRAGAGTGGGGQMVVHAIDQLDARPLPGIEAFRDPFISPDGLWIGFFQPDGLKKISMTGGPSIALCPALGVPRGATWGPDDTIIFATSAATGLLSVSSSGGEPKMLTAPDAAHGEADHIFPSLLPGGKALLFTIAALDQAVDNQIAVLDLTTGAHKILIRSGSHAEYVGSGHLVYAAAGILRAVRFDLKRLEVRSDPVPVVEQVMTTDAGEAIFAVSRTGTLVYVSGGVRGGHGPQRSLVWVTRQGIEEPIKAPPRAYVYPRLSPDGTRVALDIRDQDQDIWIWDLARETLMRLTFDPAPDGHPVWTPDGRRIIFASQRSGAANLYWQAVNGTGSVERLTTSRNPQQPSSISRDAAYSVFDENTPAPSFKIDLLAMKGERRAQPLMETTFTERNGELSPDGRWIAYESDESGQLQIYVRPFPKVDAGRWQVSTGGGDRPMWARNGRELFFVSGDGRLAVVPVQTTGPTFSAGTAAIVFDNRWYYTGSRPDVSNGRTYDISPDGQRFLMIKDNQSVGQNSISTPASMVVVLNWFEELKRLAPAQ